MKIILNKNEIKMSFHNNRNLGFVPTMGALHNGHKSLILRSLKECDKTIVSIFVNKPQFNRKSDFKKYPKTLDRDILFLKKLNVNYLFLPSFKEIYPSGTNNKIIIISFEKKLCGRFRPGHFRAIVNVINIFLKIIKPKKMYLGEKDMQQLKIIEAYVKKKMIKTKVISCKTIREKNGIPYSSRNLLLSKKEKNLASKIYKLIYYNKKYIIKNTSFLKIIKKNILNMGIKKIEYIELININKIIKPYKKNVNYKIFIAYYLRNTRLIDNI